MAGRVHPSMLEKTPKALSFKRQGSMKGGRNEVQHEEMTQMAEMVRTNTSKNLKRQLTSSGMFSRTASKDSSNEGSSSNVRGVSLKKAASQKELVRMASEHRLENFVDNQAQMSMGNKFRARLAKWQRVNLENVSTMRKIEVFFLRFRLNLLFIIVELACSILSLVFLVYLSYWDFNPEDTLTAQLRIRPLWLAQAEIPVGSVFALTAFIRLFFAHSFHKHVLSYAFLSELLSAFPLIRDVITIIDGEVVDNGQNMLYPQSISDEMLMFSNFCEPARLIQLLKISKLLALLNNDMIREGTELYSFAIVAVLVIGAYYSFANDVDVHLFAQDGVMATKVGIGARDNYDFVDFLYGTVVASVTLGYGDVHPEGIMTQLTIYGLLGTCAILYGKLSGFGNLLERRTEYTENIYYVTLRPHVLVCGHLSPSNVKTLLRELFHPDHSRYIGTDVVLMEPSEPSPELVSLLTSNEFSFRTMYINGSTLVESDLERAAASQAKCVFVLVDHHSSNPGSADSESILRAVSIKRHINSTCEPDSTPFACVLQLLMPESKEHYLSLYATSGEEQIVCISDLKLCMLARSAECPGLLSLVHNLVKSTGDLDLEKSVPLANRGDIPYWMEDYFQGCQDEIYRIPPPEQLIQKNFLEVAKVIFERTRTESPVVVIGLCIAIDTIKPTTVIMPGDIPIPRETISLVVIADSKEAATNVVTMSWSLAHRLFSPVPPQELLKYSLLARPILDGGTEASDRSYSDLSSALAEMPTGDASAPGAASGSWRGRRGSMRRRSSNSSIGLIPKNIPEAETFEGEKKGRSFEMTGENFVRDQLRGHASLPLEDTTKEGGRLMALQTMKPTQGSFHSARSSSRASSFRRTAINNYDGLDVTEDDKMRLRKLLAPRTMDAEKVERKRRQKANGGRKKLSAMMVRHGSTKMAGSDQDSIAGTMDDLKEESEVSRWRDLDTGAKVYGKKADHEVMRNAMFGKNDRSKKGLQRKKFSLQAAKMANFLSNAETLKLEENAGHVFDSPLPYEDVLLQDCNDLSQHIVVLGCQHGLERLVATLRASFLKFIDPIVIFTPYISASSWRKIGRYPLVHVVEGWFDEEDLIRLNLQNAKACIVLREDFGDGEEFKSLLSAQGMSKEGEDAVVLFKTLLVKYNYNSTNVMCEFAHESSVRFMQSRHEFHFPIGDCEFSPAFAEGQIMMASSTCNILAAKSFFHPHISDAVFEMVAPLSSREETFTYVDSIRPAALQAIPLPEKYSGMKYSDLFLKMCMEHKCILLGLQHAPGYLDNNTHYSVINPQRQYDHKIPAAERKELRVTKGDFIFILAHEIPEIDFFDDRTPASELIQKQMIEANERASLKRKTLIAAEFASQSNPSTQPNSVFNSMHALLDSGAPSGDVSPFAVATGLHTQGGTKMPTYSPLLRSTSKIWRKNRPGDALAAPGGGGGGGNDGSASPAPVLSDTTKQVAVGGTDAVTDELSMLQAEVRGLKAKLSELEELQKERAMHGRKRLLDVKARLSKVHSPLAKLGLGAISDALPGQVS